jgi:hypothetical protein
MELEWYKIGAIVAGSAGFLTIGALLSYGVLSSLLESYFERRDLSLNNYRREMQREGELITMLDSTRHK